MGLVTEYKEPYTGKGKRLAAEIARRSDDAGMDYREACEAIREVEEAVVLLSAEDQRRLYDGKAGDPA